MAVAVAVASRPLRGSRLSAFYPAIPEDGPSLSACDSAFQLQEYITMLIRHNPHDVEKIVNIPENARVINSDDRNDDIGDKDAKGEVVVDEACWIYEHLRRLAQDLSQPLITTLQQECTRNTCPEMKAGEWLYLCVAHGNDGAMEHCCAIDYIIHTLDSATALLNSPRVFPSRLSIPQASLRHFSSLARRLGRIFAHAYFHHREAFEAAEAETSLYARFLALTMRFALVPAEFLVIPPRMAHLVPGAQGVVGLNAEREKERNGGGERGFDTNSGAADQPRLLNASLQAQQRQESQPPLLSDKLTDSPGMHDVIDVSPENSDRSWSPDKAALGGLGSNSGAVDSPRKIGRNRTDTMVHSDFMTFSEEMKGASGVGSMSGLGINLVPSGREVEKVEKHDDEQGGLRSGWDEVPLDVNAEGREDEEHPDDETDQEPPEADIDSDPLGPSSHSQESEPATTLHHPYQTSTVEDEVSTMETTSNSRDPPSGPVTSAPGDEPPPTQPSLSNIAIMSLPDHTELILIAQSSEVCFPRAPETQSASPPASASDDTDSAIETTEPTPEAVDPQSTLTSASTTTICTATLESPVGADVGPGGFIILGEPGIMCRPSADGTCSGFSYSDVKGGVAETVDDKVDEDVVEGIDEQKRKAKEDAQDDNSENDSKDEKDVEDIDKDKVTTAANTSAGSTSFGNVTLGNITLEEDLREVEKEL